ncbi:hypothetical protein HOY80DRAFT_1045032 [Tuber brumale]|nr:hypothetical protein HOY80DRAFT_1045032 [Tuber brumale]
MATEAIANAADANFSTKGLTMMSLIITEAHQIKILTIIVQIHANTLQAHMAKEMMAQKGPETSQKELKKGKGKRKVEEEPTTRKPLAAKYAKEEKTDRDSDK